MSVLGWRMLRGRWRTALEQTTRNDFVRRLPSQLTTLMLRDDRWSVAQALDFCRFAQGGWPPSVLAALAPVLSPGQASGCLTETLRQASASNSYTDAQGLAAVLCRLGLTGQGGTADAAYRRLSPQLRARVSAGYIAGLGPSVGSARVLRLIEDVCEHVVRVPPVSTQVEILFALLPWVARAQQNVLVERGLALLWAAELPVTAEHWFQIGAVDPQRVLKAAGREAADDSRAWAFAAVSFHLRGESRTMALCAWLESARCVVAAGFKLRGNRIPTQLPPELLAETLAWLQSACEVEDEVYVLNALACDRGDARLQTSLVDQARIAARDLRPLDRALASIQIASQVTGPGNFPALREALILLREHRKRDPPDFFGVQRAWLGRATSGRTIADWRARALWHLPAPECVAGADELLADCGGHEDHSAGAMALAALATQLPPRRRKRWLSAGRNLLARAGRPAIAHLELALAGEGPLDVALLERAMGDEDATPAQISAGLARVPDAQATRRCLLAGCLHAQPAPRWRRWCSALTRGATLEVSQYAFELAGQQPFRERVQCDCALFPTLPQQLRSQALRRILVDFAAIDQLSAGHSQALCGLCFELTVHEQRLLAKQPRLLAVLEQALGSDKTRGHPLIPSIEGWLAGGHSSRANLLRETSRLAPKLFAEGGAQLVEGWAAAVVEYVGEQ